MVVVLTIVVFIAATILLVAFRLYRRRRSTQRGLGYEQSSLSSSPATSSKPRVSLGMPNFPKVQNKLKILAAFVTVVIVIIVLAESVVIV